MNCYDYLKARVKFLMLQDCDNHSNLELLRLACKNRRNYLLQIKIIFLKSHNVPKFLHAFKVYPMFFCKSGYTVITNVFLSSRLGLTKSVARFGNITLFGETFYHWQGKFLKLKNSPRKDFFWGFLLRLCLILILRINFWLIFNLKYI